MPKAFADAPSIQWSINASLHIWFQNFAERLGTNGSFLLRAFCTQLKEGDPVITKQLDTMLECGMRAAILDPKVARFYLDAPTRDWLTSYLQHLRHPKYPRRRVWVRHLINGYLLWLQQSEGRGMVFRPGNLLREQI